MRTKNSGVHTTLAYQANQCFYEEAKLHFQRLRNTRVRRLMINGVISQTTS